MLGYKNVKKECIDKRLDLTAGALNNKCRDMNLDMPSSWMEYGGEIIKQRFGGVNNWAKYYNSTETKNSFQMLSNAVAKKENGYEPKNILNITETIQSYFLATRLLIDHG